MSFIDRYGNTLSISNEQQSINYLNESMLTHEFFDLSHKILRLLYRVVYAISYSI